MVERRTIRRPNERRARVTMLGISVLIAACGDPSHPTAPANKVATPNPSPTVGQGSVPTFIGQGTFAGVVDIAKRTDDWDVALTATRGLEVVVRSFMYAPGAYTGWHKHPGPVLIQVVKGTVTFFEADDPCTPIVVTEGNGYVDDGSGHIGRNLSELHAQDVTIYLAPPGTQVSQLRIDMDAPPGAESCS